MDEARLAVLEEKVRAIEVRQVEALKAAADLREEMVSQVEFGPVKLIVFSMTGLVLAAVLGAIVALVVKGG